MSPGYGSNVPSTSPAASPLSVADLTSAFRRRGLDLPTPVALATTSSTNDDAATAASKGAPEWTVVVANHQSAGRGRLGRQWEAPPGSALLFSVVLRPPRHWVRQLGWVPLQSGLAVAEGICALGLEVRVKWPNDLVIDKDGSEPQLRKLAGLLAERRDSAVIVGVGINVNLAKRQLPVPAATALNLEGLDAGRGEVLAEVIAAWQRRWADLIAADGDVEAVGLRDEYRGSCISVGRRVRVDVPSGEPIVGQAVDIDSDGHLVVDASGTRVLVSAGDVHHLY